MRTASQRGSRTTTSRTPPRRTGCPRPHTPHPPPATPAAGTHRPHPPAAPAARHPVGAAEPIQIAGSWEVTTVHVPADQPAGTYWYHPHLHGSTAEQIVGGMAGVIVVEGDVDEVPEIRAAADVVVCINELKLKDGTVPACTTGSWVTGVPSTLTVNGTVNPTLRLRPGEVQRWRLVAATAFTGLSLQVTADRTALTMHQIAQDGVTFTAPVPLSRLV
ncbi:multicopper oxidase domain-containing protein [Kitasatospora sp. NPDC048545]|uniref:multicopper oxidase domain-containing protein n=1 Tax=Kitasatospora sp. NPDC048545 TaxID=3157208 RepID=UPI0033F09F6F